LLSGKSRMVVDCCPVVPVAACFEKVMSDIDDINHMIICILIPHKELHSLEKLEKGHHLALWSCTTCRLNRCYPLLAVHQCKPSSASLTLHSSKMLSLNVGDTHGAALAGWRQVAIGQPPYGVRVQV
jgi:hypothetical protein